jgi:hypothetical protein
MGRKKKMEERKVRREQTKNKQDYKTGQEDVQG